MIKSKVINIYSYIFSKWFRFLTFMFRSLIHNVLVLHVSWSKVLMSLFYRCMFLAAFFWRVIPFYWRVSMTLSEPFHCICKGLFIGSLFYSVVLCSYLNAWTILGWVFQICVLCNQHAWVQSCCLVFVILLWLFWIPRNFMISFPIFCQNAISLTEIVLNVYISLKLLPSWCLPFHEHILHLHFFLPFIFF